MKRRASSILILVFVATTSTPGAHADCILGPDLSALASLDAAGPGSNATRSAPPTVGAERCCKATAAAGFMPAPLTMSVGAVQIGDSTARSGQKSAQRESVVRITALSALVLRPPESFNFDGGDTADAFRVFQVGNSLASASTSDFDLVSTGSGAGVYWAMSPGEETFGPGSRTHTEPRGNFPTQASSLTLVDTTSVGAASSGIRDAIDGVSLSRDGAIDGGTKGGVITSLSVSPVPEPATLLLLGTGFAGLFIGKAGRRRAKARRAQQSMHAS